MTKPPVVAAVVIFTVLRRAGEVPHTLLVRQFRPPVNAATSFVVCAWHGSHCCVLPMLQMAGLTLELPAGLIDPGESPAAAALRELKEETGYAATVRPDRAVTSLHA